MRKQIKVVAFSIMVIVGFFMLWGTVGAIDLLPAPQMPTAQMYWQLVIACVLSAVGTYGLNRTYGDKKC